MTNGDKLRGANDSGLASFIASLIHGASDPDSEEWRKLFDAIKTWLEKEANQ